MSKDLFSAAALAIMLVFVIVKADNYDDKSGDDDDQNHNSLESESVEVYNSSSKEKPERVTGVKSHMKDNDVYACKDTELITKKQVGIRNYKTNYPYLVSVQKKGSHYASGALVDKRWILTVAREFYNVRESIKLYKARLGSVNCKKGGDLVPLKWIEVHPLYVYNEPNFDLAMLRIAKVLEFSEFIRPIKLSNVKGQVVNAKLLTAYWPRLLINGKVLPENANERLKPNSLRVSKQSLIPWNKCYKLSQIQNFSLDASSLCLEPIISHHSPCTPDAGAPIAADDYLWGITSGWTSLACSSYPSPTIFTRISSTRIRSWLDSLL
ncbi:transmembrane protease serine 9-like [Melitaea cinxia]|uniref:transmembrane protease serine 9-like n=1 Tax=Melitaea cinxia TaxID=113334 RepID=UPI001E2702CB|nr:transmembrane protease serine 9-like [Melitaea cinxia]